VKKKTTKKIKKYHLLNYVEDCSIKLKKFDTPEEMGKFIENFQKEHPDHLSSDSGYWIDYAVMGVSGEIRFFTVAIEVK